MAGSPAGEPWYNRLMRYVSSHWDEQPRVEILGTRDSGDNVVVRFRASRATPYVRVHVQHDAVGGQSFDGATYVSSVRVDCRAERQQDYTVTRDTAYNYHVWFAPELVEGDGTFTRYTGEVGEGADYMAYVGLGAANRLVLKAPNGTRYALSVSNFGGMYLTNLTTSAVRKFYAIEVGGSAPATVADETIYFEE
jgi:DNA-binding beta-propeller fold protein YncE